MAQILVNATNSYDKVDVEPELIELAKFSKQHVPEEHKKVSRWRHCTSRFGNCKLLQTVSNMKEIATTILSKSKDRTGVSLTKNTQTDNANGRNEISL